MQKYSLKLHFNIFNFSYTTMVQVKQPWYR